MLLDRILADDTPFALLRRSPDVVDVLVGDVVEVARLADIPLSDKEVLAIVPYRQIAERGFECVDDGAPLLALRVTSRETCTLDEVLARVHDVPFELADARFRRGRRQLRRDRRKVLAEEIGQGAGANFVIRRTYTAHDRRLHRRHRAGRVPPAPARRTRRVLDLPGAHRHAHLRRRHPRAARRGAATAWR